MTIDSSTYAFMAAAEDDGVQIIDIIQTKHIPLQSAVIDGQDNFLAS